MEKTNLLLQVAWNMRSNNRDCTLGGNKKAALRELICLNGPQPSAPNIVENDRWLGRDFDVVVHSDRAAWVKVSLIKRKTREEDIVAKWHAMVSGYFISPQSFPCFS
ncbi:MAG TPA: hypothetical protein VNZ03_31945 [Terriglobales bacterium]|jgi:hypothetical protein|nr:hypothetical protein [Terriglobales bacterium]